MGGSCAPPFLPPSLSLIFWSSNVCWVLTNDPAAELVLSSSLSLDAAAHPPHPPSPPSLHPSLRPGHGVTIISATIQDKALIGIGSVISEGALIETGAQLAAGSVVPPGRRIPAGELWGGNPVKFIRKLEDEEVVANVTAAEAYHALARSHENEFQPFGAAYLDAEKVKVSK